MTLLINSKITIGFSKNLPKKTNQRVFLSGQQIHEAKIKVLNSETITGSQVFANCDGLLYQQLKTPHKICVYVKSADCLPLLIYSLKNQLFGAVHMGYKGALQGILTNLVSLLTELRVDFQSLKVVFGPSINGACYNIPMSRFEQFSQRFANSNQFLFQAGHNYFLSLASFAFYNLRRLGIPKSSFQWNLYCTHCQKQQFYSFRRGDRHHNQYSYLIYET